MRKLIVLMVMAATMFGQAPAAKPHVSAVPRKPAAVAKLGVDTVIEMVKDGMSEPLVIKTLQRDGKAYALATPDVLKLHKAGVSENIINVMMDPKATVAVLAKPPAVTPPPATGNSTPATSETALQPAGGSVPDAGPPTPPPPALENVPAVRKRRVAIYPIDFRTDKRWISYWFNSDVNIGEGLRSMLTARLGDSKNITLLERNKIEEVKKTQDGSKSDRYNQGQTLKRSNLSVADCIIYGDVLTFGLENKTQQTGAKDQAIAVLKKRSPWPVYTNRAMEFKGISKEDKAVVGIALRIVDAETGETIATAEARGVSSRKSKDYSGSLGGAGAAGGAGTSMTNSNFEQTIIGDATANAMSQLVKQLEEKIPGIPAKVRHIEGRVATIIANGAYLNIGANDGVQMGDRFEILRIDNVVINPDTNDPIDIEASKIGELVVNNVREKTAIGNYGGQPLLQAQLAGRGYAARLMTK